jgi:hypothetical protein
MNVNTNIDKNININIIVNVNIDKNVQSVSRSLSPLTFNHRNATDNSAEYDARILIPYKGKIIPSNSKYNPNS